MKTQYVALVLSSVFCLFAANSAFAAVDTAEIDRVRNKGVLDETDLKIIDKFAADAVRSLTESRDYTSISKDRAIILSRCSSERQDQDQYSAQFFESAHRYIGEAFEAVEQSTSHEYRFKAQLNLLILVDGLDDIRLADLALAMLKNENPVIRYWAVRCLTGESITRQLNSGATDDSELGGKIIEQLAGLIDKSCPETIALMAEFVGKLSIPEARDLLLRIADSRISRYADWAVEAELLDSTVLRLLCEKIVSAGQSDVAVARRFGQLYSYAIQRYIRGQGFLSSTQKAELASVLVETEKSCISHVLAPQSVIKGAVERGSYAALSQEHSRLLGDDTQAGRLASELNFDYGKEGGGGRRVAPLVLTDPPKDKTSDRD